jgi:glutaminase
MLRNFGIIEGDPEPALDLYFRQCSVRITCRDLSIMGATLAGGGTNPVTRERALRPSNVDEVLSVMTTCGMYDYAGEWLYRVGLPAKSGVSGGILAVLPGQLAIAVFSPPLDSRGNSVRGVAVCEALSEELELHFLRAPRPSISALRSRATLRTVGSKRVRFDPQRRVLAAHGSEAVVYQLQGDLRFASVEAVIRRLVREPPHVAHVVLDLDRVTDVDPPSARLLLDLCASLAGQGRAMAFSGTVRQPGLVRLLEETWAASGSPRPAVFDQLELALEWCENAILAAHGAGPQDRGELPLPDHELLRGLDADQLELMGSLLERRTFAPRQMLVRKGEAADEIFLLVHGELSVLGDLRDGRLRRLATLSPGMVFGEPAILEGATRSAFVRADRPSICWVLKRAAFESLSASCPALKIRLLENLVGSATRTVGLLSVDALGDESA